MVVIVRACFGAAGPVWPCVCEALTSSLHTCDQCKHAFGNRTGPPALSARAHISSACSCPRPLVLAQARTALLAGGCKTRSRECARTDPGEGSTHVALHSHARKNLQRQEVLRQAARLAALHTRLHTTHRARQRLALSIRARLQRSQHQGAAPVADSVAAAQDHTRWPDDVTVHLGVCHARRSHGRFMVIARRATLSKLLSVTRRAVTRR